MIGLKIEQPKDLMTQLLKQTLFDDYLCNQIEISTLTDFKISCNVNKTYLTEDEIPLRQTLEYLMWQEIKPIVLAIIKGNKSPLLLKMTLILPDKFYPLLIQHYQVTLPLESIKGLYLNITFKDSLLKITTATSLNTFIMDKSIDIAWDDYICKFFKKHLIGYELC